MDAVIVTSGSLLRDGRLHASVWTVLGKQVSPSGSDDEEDEG